MLALSRALRWAHSHHETPVILIDEPTQGMSPQVAARTYALLTALTTLPACVVLAEQRLPPALRANAGRAAGTTGTAGTAGTAETAETAETAGTAGTAVVVHELRRGTVVFSGEAAELSPSG
ncbi:hypothetical protein A7J05_28190 [Streptomyces alfalfae]|uniref:ABC transporter n=1 Tax=Streptomyces alfalfae TaxID=1642299 RepID=A0ABM6GZT4_9ACTN|nr:hypothetical protein A7J05_28190 [Streptomyces alfalfae]